jgi:ferredoxin-nitrate reductase
MAGMALVEQLLAHGTPGESVTLVGAEPELPYDRIKLSHALAGEAAPGHLTLRDGAWFADRGVGMRTGVAAVALDTNARTAALSDGSAIEFDRFVLATGSQPALPPIEGLHRRGVHSFRSLRDVAAIASVPPSDAPAVVIGGGLLGLEAARGLQARGHRVTVIHIADRLMEQQLDELGAGVLGRRLSELGIEVRLNAATTAITGNGRVEGLRMSDGDELEAALVVVATGIRPDVALAREAGLEVQRGVVVDDELRTSAPGGWAVGECAEHRGVVYGLWAPLLRHAKTAAAVICGKPASFHGAIPATTLKVMGVDLFCAGRAEPGEGEEQILSLDSRRGRYRKLVIADDRLVGAVLLGNLDEAPLLRRLVEEHARVPPELLEDGERPAPAITGVVCSCAGVTREQIDAAVGANGLERVSDVARMTGACTGCGSCRPQIERILAEHAPESLRDIRAARAG